MGPGLTHQSFLNTSMGHLDDFGKSYNPATTFEVFYEEKPERAEDLYLDFNDIQSKHYEEYMDKKPYQDLDQPAFSSSKAQSNVMEWSKVLQKLFNQEKSSIGTTDTKNKLSKAYRTIVNLKERNWYEEMTILYKEKHVMSKTTNMTGLTFDRKLIQLQEQFRWFVNAVANVKLNNNSTTGVYEFPPFRSAGRTKRSTDKFDFSNTSVNKGNMSMTESDIISDLQSPNKQGGYPLSQFSKKSASFALGVKIENNDPKLNLIYELPEINSAIWHVGFIWKGAFFKLYSKKEAQALKKEMKALKHMSIEYLQTESSLKITDPTPYFGSTNENIDLSKSPGGQWINFILPLACLVESSSWVLYSTPVFPLKKSANDDYGSRLAHEGSYFFKNSFLLGGLTPKNFKVYYKPDDNMSSNFSSPSLGNQFVMISNISKTMIPLPKVDVMFVLNQDPQTHVAFLDYPKRGLLDVDLVKKALGYSKLDIGTAGLIKKDPKSDNKQLYFEVIKLKRRGWQVVMVCVSSWNGQYHGSFMKNKRAMDILAHSEKRNRREIRGNVMIFATLPNKDTMIHPYFISDQIANQSFLDEILDPIDLSLAKQPTPKPKNKTTDSFVKDTSIKASFKYNKLSKDDKLY